MTPEIYEKQLDKIWNLEADMAVVKNDVAYIKVFLEDLEKKILDSTKMLTKSGNRMYKDLELRLGVAEKAIARHERWKSEMTIRFSIFMGVITAVIQFVMPFITEWLKK